MSPAHFPTPLCAGPYEYCGSIARRTRRLHACRTRREADRQQNLAVLCAQLGADPAEAPQMEARLAWARVGVCRGGLSRHGTIIKSFHCPPVPPHAGRQTSATSIIDIPGSSSRACEVPAIFKLSGGSCRRVVWVHCCRSLSGDTPAMGFGPQRVICFESRAVWW